MEITLVTKENHDRDMNLMQKSAQALTDEVRGMGETLGLTGDGAELLKGEVTVRAGQGATFSVRDYEYAFEPGESYRFSFDGYSGSQLLLGRVYLYRADGTNFNVLTGGSWQWHVGDTTVFVPEEPFVKVRFYVAVAQAEDAAGAFSYGTARAAAQEGYVQQFDRRIAALEDGALLDRGVKVLVLGDSYSGQRKWLEALAGFIGIEEIVNLAVGNATLRDIKTDRAAYPYTSRPLSSYTQSGNPNQNTVACQIEKLKRWMAGTDLDEGERQVYASPEDYPDIILIEASKNDNYNLDTQTDAEYLEILYTHSNAYTAVNGGSAAQRDVWLPADTETIDRTNYAGAVRYLYHTLHAMFPKALIFVVNTSGLYGIGRDPMIDYEKSDRLRRVCRMQSIPCIDWYGEGMVSALEYGVTGSGTAEDPYISNNQSELAVDGLHPNYKGAELLALKVAAELKMYVVLLDRMRYQ